MSLSPSPGQSPLPLDDAQALRRGPEAGQLLVRRALPPRDGVFDELRAGGALRPAWQRFADWWPGLSPTVALEDDLDRRRAQVVAQLHRDGVTHNVFGEQGAAARAWSLELLPLLIEPADWQHIEQGVRQRAALLERLLVDLYGPRRLLHEALLPPALLYRHPGFLRPLQGVRPAGGQWLSIVAFDLARGPDGRWWLVAQRTQGPSGLGYVLHNRLTIAAQFPDAFRELRVQHIASSYRRLLDTLEQRAGAVCAGASPRIVLLTPGLYSETYFEHAYLARYLGLPLVEGNDLTVRGERLYLKTVEGLEPVHGVLRRLDDEWCDPLELRSDSALGVPGLLQAVRAGQVVLANALGSGFLETPALQGFLPAIARRWLGEELLLPALPSWWCGEAAAWSDTRGTLGQRVLRTTFPGAGRTTRVQVPVPEMIDDDPAAWTVQERLRFSCAPIWGDGVVTPRPALVRVYVIADAAGRWHALPGGMTRVARREDASVSMQRGGTSLDSWVLTDGPVDTFSMLPQRLRVDDIAARRRPVSSRTGENLFWMGRYTERTEQQVRLARSLLQGVEGDPESAQAQWQALSALAVRAGLVPWGVPSLRQAPLVFTRALLQSLRERQGAACSVGYNLAALERCAQALRERLSAEQWSLIRSMDESFAQALETPDGNLPEPAQVLPALDRLAIWLAAVTGAQSDRMTRDHGWRLLTVGRLTERLIGLCTSFDCYLEAGALGSEAGNGQLLEQFDSAITFRARYQRHEDLLALTDLLVLDSANPRSLAGVLRRLRTELGKLPGLPEQREQLLALLPPTGAGLTLEQLRDADDAHITQALHTLVQGLRAAAAGLAERVGALFFTLAHDQSRSV